MINVSFMFSRLKGSQLFNDSFWALLGSVLGKGLSLIAGVVVARFLGSEIYGEYGTIKNTLVYIAIVSTFGFGYSATKFITDYIINNKAKVYDLSKKIQLITLTFSSVLALLLILYADYIAEILNAPHLDNILRRSSILVVLNAFTTTQISILSGFKAFKKLSIINTITGVVTIITSTLFTYYWGLNGALISLLFAYIVQAIANHNAISNLIFSDNKTEICHFTEIKKMLSFSLPIALQESLYTIIHWATLYLLIRYANYSEVGLSSVSSMWSSVVIFIPSALRNVMFSHLSSSSNQNKLVNRLLCINFVSTVVPVVVLICLSGLLTAIYGESFNGLEKVLNVCLISSIFICMSEVYCYEFIASGKPWVVFMSRLIRDGLVVLLSFFSLQCVTKDHAFYMSCVSLCCHILYFLILFTMYKIANVNYAKHQIK